MKKYITAVLFLFALVTSALAVAEEPAYDVVFISTKPYVFEKEDFYANVPHVEAVSLLDWQTPVPKYAKAVKEVNQALREYVNKAYKEYKRKGNPDTWIYAKVTKNGDNIYSLLVNKEEHNGRDMEFYQEAFTFLQHTGERVTWQEIASSENENLLTVEHLKKNMEDGRFYRYYGEMIAELPEGFPGEYILDKMPGAYDFYVDESELIIFMIPVGTKRPFTEGCIEVNSGVATKYSRAVG